MKTKLALAALALVAANPVFAGTAFGGAVQVPEIDAAAGLAGFAALGATVAMLRERFKR
ncbi:hypothetical protein [Mangrovicoccus ximenensis]|uniref:hypothetical protein n=1 Tax=Mangrovicoccus ximenensis TaxID=1911570 RepID=UPI001374E0D3|nr:hypothetical protein [Mangrovicoccus ximenensis]